MNELDDNALGCETAVDKLFQLVQRVGCVSNYTYLTARTAVVEKTGRPSQVGGIFATAANTD